MPATPLPLQEVKAYAKLRIERMNLRMTGIRAKKAKEAAKESETATAPAKAAAE